MATNEDTDFIDWWRLLNGALDRLHKGQQAGLADARGCYDAGETPEIAAQMLFDLWTKPGRMPSGDLKR